MTTTAALPLVADPDLPAPQQTLRVEAVRCGTWPEPATLIGYAVGEYAWDIAAMANEFHDLTGCQMTLPGYFPAGG